MNIINLRINADTKLWDSMRMILANVRTLDLLLSFPKNLGEKRDMTYFNGLSYPSSKFALMDGLIS